MATYRIGIGSFNLKDGAVGIGTESSGLGNLKVEGTIKTTDLDVTGVSTFTRYAGFVVDNIEIGKDNRDLSLTGEHQTTGDIVVGVNSTFTVSTGATVTLGSVSNVSIGTHFSPPTGGVKERPEAPVEGTVRFNRDLNTLEFYNGIEWRQFTVSGASGRGIIGGGATPADNNKSDRIESIQIPTLGNAIDFGTLTQSRRYPAACSSNSRGIWTGGIYPGPTFSNVIDYITIASKGNAQDFGDLEGGRAAKAGASSQTRGVFGGGYQPSAKNTMEYITIQTTGNSINFGDMTTAGYYGSGCSSPVRAMFQGNTSNNSYAKYSYLNFATMGDAIEWGEPNFKRTSNAFASNSVRGINAGGENARSPWFDFATNSIEYITIASLGSAEYFGDLTEDKQSSFNGCASNIRAVFCGGYNGSSSVKSSDYVTIMTQGNATNFGDLGGARRAGACSSDSHGGLGGY